MIYKNYFEQLKQAIPLLMEESNIPGFSISVCDKEKIIFSNTYGFTDSSRTFPVTSTTQFSLQSISKTYTAFGFMLAVQDNKVSLDEPVKKYVPEFSVRHKDGGDYSSAVTFRQCLTHRTGLRHEAPVGSNYIYSGTFEEHIKSINGTFLRFKPGEHYSYSNLGVDLAAYALGKIYDMPFEEYMLKKVFEPLEMKTSTFDQKDFLMKIDSAVGHAKTALVKYPVMMLGAGGMYSTADDMMNFIRCFLNRGIYNGKRIMKQEILEQMYNEYPPSNEWPYNLGLVAGLVKERAVLNHNGMGFGFLAIQDIFPENDLGAAALINSAENPDARIRLCRSMWSDLFALQDDGKTDCEPIPESYEPFLGIYEASRNDNGGSLKMAVVPRNGAIYCYGSKLDHHSGNLFFNEQNDCVEFIENGMKFDNITLQRMNVYE